MMTAGYSDTPLPKKLGISAGQAVLLLGDPLGFDIGSLGVPIHTTPAGSYPVVLLFCPDVATLIDLFDRAKAAHTQSGTIWVCWPKKSSGVRTDLSETVVRDFGLDHGRVDVKVAAVDAVWSGLKFVIRLADRR